MNPQDVTFSGDNHANPDTDYRHLSSSPKHASDTSNKPLHSAQNPDVSTHHKTSKKTNATLPQKKPAPSNKHHVSSSSFTSLNQEPVFQHGEKMLFQRDLLDKSRQRHKQTTTVEKSKTVKKKKHLEVTSPSSAHIVIPPAIHASKYRDSTRKNKSYDHVLEKPHSEIVICNDAVTGNASHLNKIEAKSETGEIECDYETLERMFQQMNLPLLHSRAKKEDDLLSPSFKTRPHEKAQDCFVQPVANHSSKLFDRVHALDNTDAWNDQEDVSLWFKNKTLCVEQYDLYWSRGMDHMWTWHQQIFFACVFWTCEQALQQFPHLKSLYSIQNHCNGVIMRSSGDALTRMVHVCFPFPSFLIEEADQTMQKLQALQSKSVEIVQHVQHRYMEHYQDRNNNNTCTTTSQSIDAQSCIDPGHDITAMLDFYAHHNDNNKDAIPPLATKYHDNDSSLLSLMPADSHNLFDTHESFSHNKMMRFMMKQPTNAVMDQYYHHSSNTTKHAHDALHDLSKMQFPVYQNPAFDEILRGMIRCMKTIDQSRVEYYNLTRSNFESRIQHGTRHLHAMLLLTRTMIQTVRERMEQKLRFWNNMEQDIQKHFTDQRVHIEQKSTELLSSLKRLIHDTFLYTYDPRYQSALDALHLFLDKTMIHHDTECISSSSGSSNKNNKEGDALQKNPVVFDYGTIVGLRNLIREMKQSMYDTPECNQVLSHLHNELQTIRSKFDHLRQQLQSLIQQQYNKSLSPCINNDSTDSSKQQQPIKKDASRRNNDATKETRQQRDLNSVCSATNTCARDKHAIPCASQSDTKTTDKEHDKDNHFVSVQDKISFYYKQFLKLKTHAQHIHEIIRRYHHSPLEVHNRMLHRLERFDQQVEQYLALWHDHCGHQEQCTVIVREEVCTNLNQFIHHVYQEYKDIYETLKRRYLTREQELKLEYAHQCKTIIKHVQYANQLLHAMDQKLMFYKQSEVYKQKRIEFEQIQSIMDEMMHRVNNIHLFHMAHEHLYQAWSCLHRLLHTRNNNNE